MSNLRLVSESTISASVASINITDVFSADYDAYKVVVNDLATSG